MDIAGWESFMERAAVLIGVKKSHNLPALQAAWDGVRQMEAWAKSQGIDGDRIKTITDESELVDTRRIKRAVRALVDKHTIEQLIVYFAGHGINSFRSEYWLLSDAIIDPNEAVNVTGSEDLARYCGIPHVVFFSDACRTAAVGIQAQGVSGNVIFPNLGAQGLEKQVDLFFATTLGHPSLEIQNVDDATRAYRAVYTDTLVAALNGKYPEIIEQDADLGAGVIRCWPLKILLSRKVSERVYQETQRSQQPDARITSPPSAWLSRFAPEPPRHQPVTEPDPYDEVRTTGSLSAGPTFGELEELNEVSSGGRRGRFDDAMETPAHRGVSEPPSRVPAPRSTRPPKPRPVTLLTVSRSVLRDALDSTPATTVPDVLESMAMADAEALRVFEETATLASGDFGPTHFETGCGFKVRGTAVRQAFAADVQIEVLGAERNLVRVHPTAGRARTVVLEFDDGVGMAVPALNEFLAAITFDRGELIHVSFDPSEGSWRWSAFQARREALQRLRGIVAASTRMGTFRLESEAVADDVAREMQLAKAYDPVLALYAAYAYRDQGLRDRIETMERYQRDDLGISFFDIALMARRLDGTVFGSDANVLPALPLLSQGWALLASHEVVFPPELEEIRHHVVRDSLWTLYDATGLDLIRNALQKGVIQ